MNARPELRFSVRVSTGGRTLVDIDEYRIPDRKIMMLFGESGIGKSLLNRAVYGLLDPDEFTVSVNGLDAPMYRSTSWVREIQSNGFFVFQEPSTHLHPLLTIGQQLREGTLYNAPGEAQILGELWSSHGSAQAEKLLEIYPKPYRPSGGEKQRVLLAMAFKKLDRFLASRQTDRPALFLFDEPTGSLDNNFRDLILGMLLDRFRRTAYSAVVISHDYSMISMIRRNHPDLADDILFNELVLEHGSLVQKEFRPERYLEWIGSQQTPGYAGGDPKHPVGFVESDIKVFGRNLMITGDREAKIPLPMWLLPGRMTYLKAPSGTGKTTLVKLMMGLLRGEYFRMNLGRDSINEQTSEAFWRRNVWGRTMTMVFQHADEALNPRSTVRDTFRGLPSKGPVVRERILHTLEELFDADVAREILDHEVARLSGGQKQKLNLLRGLFLETQLIILDEPLNGLDFDSTTRVLLMLRQRLRRGNAILVISHNEEIFDSQVREEDVYYLSEKHGVSQSV